MPKPRVPDKIKIQKGTNQPNRMHEALEMPIVIEYPKPPQWLPNKHAKDEWFRIVPILVNNGLLTEVGIAPLAVLCSLHGRIVEIFEKGGTPNGFTLSQYRALVNDFGITPVAQTKVRNLLDSKPKPNAFANNGRKRN